MSTNVSARMGTMTRTLALAALLTALPQATAWAAPGNDDIGNAVTLSSGNNPVTGTNAAATTQPGENLWGGRTAMTVWYSWTAAADGNVTFTTCNAGTDFDTTLQAFPAGNFAAAPLAQNDDATCPAASRASSITFPVTGGSSYSIQVGGYTSGGSTNSGAFVLSYSGVAAMEGGEDLTVQMLATTRASRDATCPTGYAPSWAEWPFNGTGGWVCDRFIYAYYPDRPVR